MDSVFTSNPLEIEIEKENLRPYENMKTILKIGGNSLGSPFAKSGGSKYKPFKILSDEEKTVTKLKEPYSDSGKPSKRKSLATLQVTSKGKGSLTGQNRESLSIKDSFLKKKGKSPSSSTLKKEKISDISMPVIDSDIEVSSSEDTDCFVQDAISLMKATEKVDDSYWKSIAEDRRIALEETLTENDKLYNELDEYEKENQKLKKELSDVECYKVLYNNLLVQLEADTKKCDKK